MTTLLRRYTPSLLSLLVLMLFAVYISRNASEFAQLLNLSLPLLLLAVFLHTLNFAGNGLINLLLYRRLGATVGVTESMSLAAVNSLANLLPFAGGMVAKGVYLKRRFKLGYTRFLSATVALFMLMVAASGAVGLATLTYRSFGPEDETPLLLVGGFVVMLLSLTILWLPPSLVPRGRWSVRFQQFLDGWRFMRRRPRLLVLLLLLQLGLTFVLASSYWIAFRIMSQPVSLADCLLFAAGSVLTQLVTITPDGLGVREGIVGAIASLLGFDLGISIVAVTIYRLIGTAITIALGSLASYHLARRLGAEPAVEVETEVRG